MEFLLKVSIKIIFGKSSYEVSSGRKLNFQEEIVTVQDAFDGFVRGKLCNNTETYTYAFIDKNFTFRVEKL